MKKVFVTLLMMAFFVASSSAQGIFFGVKGGLNNTKLNTDMEGVTLDSDYGWFIGPTLRIDLLPFLGVQGSAFYSQAQSKLNGVKIKQKSVLIPIDARLNIPINDGTAIFISTGPQFGFNTGEDDYNIFGEHSSQAKENIQNTFQLKKSMFSWNIGGGLSLTKHIELGFVYSVALTNTGDIKNLKKEDKAKARGWQASATFYF